MPLTVTQTQVLNSHLAAFTRAINPPDPKIDHPGFEATDVMGSLVYELGPFVGPMLADLITSKHLDQTKIEPKQLERIYDLIDRAENELQTCLENQCPPSQSFKEIIIALLEQFGPILLQILISFLMEPEPKKTNQFTKR